MNVALNYTVPHYHAATKKDDSQNRLSNGAHKGLTCTSVSKQMQDYLQYAKFSQSREVMSPDDRQVVALQISTDYNTHKVTQLYTAQHRSAPN